MSNKEEPKAYIFERFRHGLTWFVQVSLRNQIAIYVHVELGNFVNRSQAILDHRSPGIFENRRRGKIEKLSKSEEARL